MSPADAATDAPAAAEAEAPRAAGKFLVLAPRNRGGTHDGTRSQSQKRERTFDERRIAAVAAVVVVATVAGAVGGAMATAALMRTGGQITNGNHALEASVARIDAEILALKVGLENNSKLAANQFHIRKLAVEAMTASALTGFEPARSAASIPLKTPAPLAMLNVIVVLFVGLAGFPFTSCDCTVTLKGVPDVPVLGTVV